MTQGVQDLRSKLLECRSPELRVPDRDETFPGSSSDPARLGKLSRLCARETTPGEEEGDLRQSKRSLHGVVGRDDLFGALRELDVVREDLGRRGEDGEGRRAPGQRLRN